MQETINVDQIVSVRVHNKRRHGFWEFVPAKHGWFSVRDEYFRDAFGRYSREELEEHVKNNCPDLVVDEVMVCYKPYVSIELSSGRKIKSVHPDSELAREFANEILALIPNKLQIKKF